MDTTQTGRVRLASSRNATAARLYKQPDDPRRIAAARELAAAKLAAEMDRARAAGLDDLDFASIALTGQLAASAQAAA